MNEADYNITLFEACEILNRTKKSISRYIRRGRLNPLKVKSLHGTLEYRFTKADIDDLRAELARVDTEDKTGQDRTDETGHARQDTPPLEKAFLSTKPDETGQGRQDKTGQDGTGQDTDIISLLKDTTELLKGQLTIKDTQIGTLNEQVHKLIERDRETNILLKGLQDKLMLLEPPKIEAIDIKQTRRDGTRQGTGLFVLAIILLLTLAVFFYLNITPILKVLYGK